MLYSLDEICLIPTQVSKVEHRGDVNILTNKNTYPIFTAPMSCITDETNLQTLKDHKLNVIVPRTVNWETRLNLLKIGEWVAVGFKEAQYLLDNLEITEGAKVRLCIDQANGHMESLLVLCKNLKDKFGDSIKLMTGNIANPYTYKKYAAAGVDYVRVSIGSGNVCTTSVQTGMHYPMGSLITKLMEEKDLVVTAKKLGAQYKSVPKIVADGGFKRIDQVVKALALGADYVMLGEIIAKSDEAAGKQVGDHREYFGMSTEKAQKIVNDASLFMVDDFEPKHTEGQVKWVNVEYPLAGWLEDFSHALRSSMSYAGAFTLDEYHGHVAWDIMTPVTYNAYMK